MKSSRLQLFLVTTGIALFLRLVHLWLMSDNPLFTRPIMDAAMHDQWARGLLDGTWPGPEPFFRAPFYPYLLGALYWIFDGARLPIQAVHALISALGAGFAGLIAARLFNRRAGYLAGLLLATLWTSIYFSAELLLVSLAVTLNLLMLWILLDREEGELSTTRIAAAGLILGLSAITRPNILILLPLLIWFIWRERPSAKRTMGLVVFLVALILPISPVAISNQVRGHDTVLIASQGGVNFYIGNNSRSDGRTAVVPDTRPTWQGGYEDAIAMAEKDAGHALKPSQVDRYFMRRGLGFLLDDPGTAVKLYGSKLRMLLGAAERSNNKYIYAWRDWSSLLRLPIWPGWAMILGLAVLGFFRCDWPGRSRRLLIGVSALYALSILLFFVNARFRLPVAAILAIPAGAGLEAVWSSLRSRPDQPRWRHGMAGPAFAVLVILLSSLDFVGFKENRTNANPFYYFTLGNAYADQGDRAEAIVNYRKSLAISTTYSHANFHMIRDNLYRSYLQMLSEEGMRPDALSAARQWTRAAPQNLEARVWLGNLLLDAGRIDEAGAHFEIAKRTDPESPDVLSGEAWILYHQKQFGKALRRFNQLTRSNADSRAYFGSGLCLIELNRLNEAEKAFLKVLELEPTYWQAVGNLAGIYERTGRLPQAKSMYQRLLALRPDDTRARQWLAGH
jgi:tetratricopeptide (TPR) repeat protein